MITWDPAMCRDLGAPPATTCLLSPALFPESCVLLAQKHGDCWLPGHCCPRMCPRAATRQKLHGPASPS